jgi:hypothetical protein
MTKTLTDLEAAFAAAAKEVRARLAECEDLNYFEFTVTADGRVNDGEMKISFELHDGNYGAAKVRGGQAGPVLDEYARRHGWQKRNAPVCIGVVEEAPHETL